MSCTPERAEEIVSALPAELRPDDLIAFLGISGIHLDRMRAQNRVPKPYYSCHGRTPIWQRDTIHAWLVERLVNREADELRANNAAKRARIFLGHGPGKASKPPLFPFLGSVL